MDTKKLRQKILDLAIHGKLVPQDPNDEPASVLLERIRAEKERLVKEGKIKKSKATTTSDTPHYENVPFEVPSSWEWTTVENICSKIGSGSTPKGSNYASEGIFFFRSQNVYNDGVVLEDIKYISEEVHQSMIGTEVLPNDLLLNITGGSLGRCAIVPNEIDRGNVSQHVCILRPIIVNAEYLHIFILSSFFAKTMKITGSGREGLPKYNLEKMLLPIPPIEEQTRIIHELNKWNDWVIAIDNNQQDLVETIKQTKSKILDLAIHGKLVPQDENDEPASELLKRINPAAEITCDNGQYGKEAFELPNTWVCCRLGDVISIKSGDSISVRNNRKGEYPIYGGNGINGYFCDYNVESDTIVIGRVGFYCGSVYKTKSKAWVTDNAFIVCYKNIFNSTYLKYVLEWLQLSKTSNSTAQPVISGKGIYPLLIPLPPLTEQQRIVYAIDTTFAKLDAIMESL